MNLPLPASHCLDCRPVVPAPDSCRGFTLIELLVVITIIVVLLSLLAPAMEEAIYQATLVQCSANIDQIGSGAMHYGYDNRRHYPQRQAVGPQAFFRNADVIRDRDNQTHNTWFDDRYMLDGYIKLASYLDPLAGQVDIDEDVAFNSMVTSVYHLFFSWGYDAGSGRSDRVGQRFGYQDASGFSRRLNVLVGDQDWLGDIFATHSHPDRDGVLQLHEYQNHDVTGYNGAGAAIGWQFVMTRWDSFNGPYRGEVDSNYGLQDGSVIRFNNVPENARKAGYAGLVRIGTWQGATETEGQYLQVPSQ